MIALLRDLPEREHRLLERAHPGTSPDPMLAVLVKEAFSDPNWIFERKLDGERVLSRRDSRGVHLTSRNGKDLNSSYPELVEALDKASPGDLASETKGSDPGGSAPIRWVGDGEVVAFHDGLTSFSRLQQRMQITDHQEARESPVAVYYYLFDLLYLDDFDLRKLPLRTRKQLLRDSFHFSDPIRFSNHRNRKGEAFHQEACRKGWEGIMAKRADSPYVAGRSRDWRKFKCVARQELVIGGYSDPDGSRIGFGALLVGYYEEDGRLRYAGKVGTGFDEDTLKRLARRLRRAERKTTPFAKEDRDQLPGKGVHWVTPKFVGDFGFTEWTRSGKLRHPRFLGLRRDKDPEDVTRERPE